MENVKKSRLQSVKKGEKKLDIGARQVFQASLFFFSGVLLGQGTVFDVLYPFGPALVIASPGVYSFFAFLGTSLGLVFSQTGVYLFRYIICVAALWLIRSHILTSRSRV